MKKLILLFLLLFSPLTVRAQDIPTQAPESGIYDPNGYLSQETINRIKDINNMYADTDLKPQLGIVIVDEVEGSIEQVANETARNWKIGFSDTNNGMLVMIDIKNRKIRTETSNNLSTYITDYQTSILNDTIKSDFRNGKYDIGIGKYLDKYVDIMNKVVSGKRYNVHEAIMSNLFTFLIAGLVALALVCFVLRVIDIITGSDDGYYGGGSSGSHYHHYYSGSSYSSRSYSSDSSSSSSSSSSGWSGGGFGGGGSTGGW